MEKRQGTLNLQETGEMRDHVWREVSRKPAENNRGLLSFREGLVKRRVEGLIGKLANPGSACVHLWRLSIVNGRPITDI